MYRACWLRPLRSLPASAFRIAKAIAFFLQLQRSNSPLSIWTDLDSDSEMTRTNKAMPMTSEQESMSILQHAFEWLFCYGICSVCHEVNSFQMKRRKNEQQLFVPDNAVQSTPSLWFQLNSQFRICAKWNRRKGKSGVMRAIFRRKKWKSIEIVHPFTLRIMLICTTDSQLVKCKTVQKWRQQQ